MKFFKSRLWFILSLMVMSMSLSQCSCSDVVGSMFVSEEDEMRLGAQFDADLKKNPSKYPLSTNAAMTAYVQGVFDQIKGAMSKDEIPSYGFKGVQLIDDPATANAFAVPGGYIYVYTGILKSMDDESELAAVLGHEISHVTHHHYRNQLAKQYGVQTLVSMLGGDSSQVSAVAQSLLALEFSREDEYDADKNGTLLAGTADWSPLGVAHFFSRMTSTGMPAVFSTHPDPGDRVVEVEKQVKLSSTLGPKGYKDYPECTLEWTTGTKPSYFDHFNGDFKKYKALVK